MDVKEREYLVNLMKLVTEKKQPERQKLVEKIIRDYGLHDSTVRELKSPVFNKGA